MSSFNRSFASTTEQQDREMCDAFNAMIESPVILTADLSEYSDQALSFDVNPAQELWIKMNGKLTVVKEEEEIEKLCAAIDEHIIEYNHYPYSAMDWRVKVSCTNSV